MICQVASVYAYMICLNACMIMHVFPGSSLSLGVPDDDDQEEGEGGESECESLAHDPVVDPLIAVNKVGDPIVKTEPEPMVVCEPDEAFFYTHFSSEPIDVFLQLCRNRQPLLKNTKQVVWKERAWCARPLVSQLEPDHSAHPIPKLLLTRIPTKCSASWL